MDQRTKLLNKTLTPENLTDLFHNRISIEETGFSAVNGDYRSDVFKIPTHLLTCDSKPHYTTHGSPSNPCILFLHGRHGNHLSWWQNIPSFCETHFCICLDMKGFGLSLDLDSQTCYGILNGISWCLHKLKIKKLSIVAQSFGCTFAVQLVHQLKNITVDNLILCSPNPALCNVPHVVESFLLKHHSPNLLSNKYRKEHVAESIVFDHIQSLNSLIYKKFDIPIILRKYGLFIKNNLPNEEELKKFNCKTFFIVGENDKTLIDIKNLFPLFSNVDFIYTIKDSGHQAFYEKHEEFNKIVLSILSGK